MATIPIVNEKDEVIGETTIKEAKEKGYIRRISRVFIFDEKGRMLIQFRSKNVHGHPLTWDQAVGGHVDYGESYAEAAVREMKEELGIRAPITEILTSYQQSDQFEGIFRATINSDTPINFDSHEVEKVEWVKIEDFERDIIVNPQNYTHGCINAWQNFRDKLIAT